LINRINVSLEKGSHDHVERARDTLEFCQAISQIFSQDVQIDTRGLMIMKRLQRQAIAIVVEHDAWSNLMGDY
jgi:transcriptional regulator